MIRHRPVPTEPAMKGRIGVARRIHYLLEVNPEGTWAVGSCKRWAGRVDLVQPVVKVTCNECVGLAQNKRVKPTITVAKEVS
jgi:hypothetical protein